MENSTSSYKERLQKFAASIGSKPTTILMELGFSTGYYSNSSTLSPRAERVLKEKYPELNINWLKTGNGKMLKKVGEYNEGEECPTVPLIPTALQGGSLQDFSKSVEEYECERIISPVEDAQLAASVSGDSMSPEYPNGSIVLLKKINEKSFIEWGRTYALDTVNGPVIKNVFPSRNEDKVVCRSVNPNYADFEVPKEDIYAWYRVLMQLCPK